MIVESRRESYAVSEYLNTGRRWYAAMDTFHATTNDNNNSTSTTSTTTENSTSTTTNNNNHPPTVSLFRNEDDNIGDNVLVQADMATRMAIRVAHMNEQMKNQQEHFSLKNDLMNHLWRKKRQRSSNQNNDEVE
jgi:hypothetical protein